MRIGVDFDNTIACYDGVFHAAALEWGLIPADIATDKTSVRDHLRAQGRDAAFTELQGHVYGARMDLVPVYPGFIDFVARAAAAGHDIFIISHKTKKPFAGPDYDLHAAARLFLADKGIVNPGAVPAEHVFFELTKTEKVARAAALSCDLFVDDLPEILAMEGWPSGMRAILFDPEEQYGAVAVGGRAFERYRSWAEIDAALFGASQA